MQIMKNKYFKIGVVVAYDENCVRTLLECIPMSSPNIRYEGHEHGDEVCFSFCLLIFICPKKKVHHLVPTLEI